MCQQPVRNILAMKISSSFFGEGGDGGLDYGMIYYSVIHVLLSAIHPTVLPTPCNAGEWAPAASSACFPCEKGYLCTQASTTPSPNEGSCPSGGWCDGINFTPCPKGYYGNVTGAASEEEGCKLCPPGYFCDTSGMTHYAENQCIPGYYCPRGTENKVQYPCAAGTFSNETKRQNPCNDICPATLYCPHGSVSGSLCPAGFYCPAGTPHYSVFPCPLGTYGPYTGRYLADQCVVCPKGHFCPSGNATHPTVSPLPCSPGTHNPLNGTGHKFNCLSCPAGMSCPTIGLVLPSHSCNQGHYCPNGTIHPNQFPCPPGTFTSETNLQSPEECTVCPAGLACGWGSGYNFSKPQFCAQGHYCPLGTPAPNKFPCPRGSFTGRNNLTSVVECSVCPKGYYCEAGKNGPSGKCPPGFYCPEGTQFADQYPCPSTTFNPLYGQFSILTCLNCTTGHFCERGTAKPEACPAGSYMPYGYDKGTNTTIGLPIGNKSECFSCPGGMFCVQRSINPMQCGRGYYSPQSSERCFVCSVGHFCDSITTSEDQMLKYKQCPPGQFCQEGLTTVNESVPCDAGFYCPQGT